MSSRKLLVFQKPDSAGDRIRDSQGHHQQILTSSSVQDLLPKPSISTDQVSLGYEKLASSSVVSERQLPSELITVNSDQSAHTKQTPISTSTIFYQKLESTGARLTQFLQSYSEPFAIRTQTMRSYHTLFGSLCCLLGPTIFRRWTDIGEEVFEIMPEWTAYGLKLTVRSPKLCQWTLSLEILAQRKIQKHEKSSLLWSMSFPKIVQRDFSAMRLARTGKVESIRELFQAGRAGCTDTTPNGTSLLHVWPLLYDSMHLVLMRSRSLLEKVIPS